MKNKDGCRDRYKPELTELSSIHQHTKMASVFYSTRSIPLPRSFKQIQKFVRNSDFDK